MGVGRDLCWPAAHQVMVWQDGGQASGARLKARRKLHHQGNSNCNALIDARHRPHAHPRRCPGSQLLLIVLPAEGQQVRLKVWVAAHVVWHAQALRSSGEDNDRGSCRCLLLLMIVKYYLLFFNLSSGVKGLMPVFVAICGTVDVFMVLRPSPPCTIRVCAWSSLPGATPPTCSIWSTPSTAPACSTSACCTPAAGAGPWVLPLREALGLGAAWSTCTCVRACASACVTFGEGRGEAPARTVGCSVPELLTPHLLAMLLKAAASLRAHLA